MGGAATVELVRVSSMELMTLGEVYVGALSPFACPRAPFHPFGTPRLSLTPCLTRPRLTSPRPRAGLNHLREVVHRVTTGRGAARGEDRLAPMAEAHDLIKQVSLPPPPSSRTDWTRLVPPPVLTGHVSSLLPCRHARPTTPTPHPPGPPAWPLRPCRAGPLDASLRAPLPHTALVLSSELRTANKTLLAPPSPPPGIPSRRFSSSSSR